MSNCPGLTVWGWFFGALISFLLVPFFVFSEQKNIDRVYTNEDLKKYEGDKKFSFESVPTQNFLFLPSAPSVVDPREVVYNSDVRVELSGCITLQDGIDRRIQGSAVASVLISGKGRTEKQICDSVGRGCATCRVLLPF